MSLQTVCRQVMRGRPWFLFYQKPTGVLVSLFWRLPYIIRDQTNVVIFFSTIVSSIPCPVLSLTFHLCVLPTDSLFSILLR